MSKPPRPILAERDNLSKPMALDANAMINLFVGQREKSPITRAPNARAVSAMLDLEYPKEGAALDALINKIAHAIERYPRRRSHPGFFGWIAPSGLATDPLAHAITAAINENVVGYVHSPVGTTIERAVIDWMKQLVGFPDSAEGVLLSGGSLANMGGIAGALSGKFGPEYKQKGLHAFCNPSVPVIICSQAAHFSILRAAAILGIGNDNVIAVETDQQFRMRLDQLERALERHANVVCVVASAGTTNTGAIDRLDGIATLCEKHNTWFHVDAAYGGGGLLSQALRSRYVGIERADSVTMDLHKWFFQSLDGSVLLYKNAGAARALFFETTDYLNTSEDLAAEEYIFYHITPELSRRFRALPFYIAMRHYGLDKLGRNVLHNVQCAEYLAQLINLDDNLEIVTAPQLSIVTFRFIQAGLSHREVDAINTTIRNQIEHEGDYLMSATQVGGRPVLRVCILNHATRAKHIEGLVENILRIGRSQ